MRLWFFKEAHKSCLFVVDDFLPEVVSLLVAFACSGRVNSYSVVLFVQFESEDEKQRAAGERLKEEFLVLGSEAAVDFSE